MKPPFDLQACWPPELRLLAAAAVRRFDAPARARCERLLAAGIDRERFLALAGPHGLAPLVSHRLASLSSLPPEMAAELSAWLREHVRSSLALAAELAHVHRTLRLASVPAVSYKGPTLALRLYDNIGLRCSGDLDVLVDPADWQRAIAALLAGGYTRLRHTTDRARQAAGDCEEQLLSPDGRTVVDLHWEIAQPYCSIGPLPGGWKARLRHLTLAEELVATFADGDNLLVLAIHGGKHRWERLGWIADFAAAIDAGGFDWDAVEQGARGMRIYHHLLLAVTLAHFVFAADVPEKILLAAHDARAPWRYAGDIMHDAAQGPAPMLTRWAFSFRMRESWADRGRVAYRFLTRPTTLELEESPLASERAFLYPAVRAGRIASRTWKAAVGGKGGTR